MKNTLGSIIAKVMVAAFLVMVVGNGSVASFAASSGEQTGTEQTGGEASPAESVSGNGTGSVSGNSVDTSQLDLKWNVGEDGKSYWYEKGVKQGTEDDPKGVMGDGTVRGREIWDPESDGWYWLDANADGAKAIGKEVWMPYVDQEEAGFDDEMIEEYANLSDVPRFITAAIKNGTGKWVRYDENGKMLKEWVTIEGALAELYPDQAGNTYYYDKLTGAMIKGYATIGGTHYHFDEVTGVQD